MRTFDINGVAAGYESLTTATAVGFTSSKILPVAGTYAGKNARSVMISVEVADVRVTLDGTTPTVTAGTAAGHLIPWGTNFEIRGETNITNFKVINAVAASGAIVKCTYFF